MRLVAIGALALASFVVFSLAPADAQAEVGGNMYLSTVSTGYQCDGGALGDNGQTSFWVLIEPSPGDQIFGWEASVVPPAAFLVLNRAYTPPTALDVGQGPDDFKVGLGTCFNNPNPFTAVQYDILIFTAEDDLIVTMEPSVLTSPVCNDNPCWLRCDEVIVIPNWGDDGAGIPAWQSGVVGWNLTDAADTCPPPYVGNDDKSWGALKADFSGE